MKFRIKKQLAGILVVVCVITLFPASALAKKGIPDSEKTGIYADITLAPSKDEVIHLYSNSRDKDKDVRRKGVSFTVKKNTLTLTNFHGYALVVNNLGSDFKLKLVGDNSFEHISILGKYGTGLTITGTGSLKVNSQGDNAAINMSGFDESTLYFTIEKSCTVDVYPTKDGSALFLMGSKTAPKVSFEGMDKVRMEDEQSTSTVSYFVKGKDSHLPDKLDEETVWDLRERDDKNYAGLHIKDGNYYLLEFYWNEAEKIEYPVLYKVEQLFTSFTGEKFAIVTIEKEYKGDEPIIGDPWKEYPFYELSIQRWGEIHTTSDGSQNEEDTQESIVASKEDTNWELLGLDYYDANEDGVLDEKEAKSVVDLSIRNGDSGSTKKEIEPSILPYCKNLKILDIKGYKVKGDGLDLSKNTKLTKIICSECYLKFLNVSKCTKLTTLKCDNWDEGNKLSKLDISNCTKLKYLNCSGNAIANLNSKKCENLLQLNCDDNRLTSLDVSKCKKLTKLECDDNQITKLNVLKNKELTHLECSFNKLAKLNVSKCTKLKELGCAGNSISKLNLTNCKKMKFLYCDASCEVIGYSGEKNCE